MESIVEVIKVEDKTRIDKVTFNNPELMSDNAEDLIKKKYTRLVGIEESLQRARQEVRSLEEKYDKAKEEWNRLKTCFTYTHPTRDKEVLKNHCDMVIKGHGNDIIGKTTVM